MMKTLLSITAVAAVAAGTTLAGTAWVPPASPAAEHAVDRELAVTGTVGRWVMTADGVLVVRLDRDPSLEDEAPWRWFRLTPQNTSVVKVEEMLLDVLLAVESAPDPAALTITGKVERGLDGTTAEEALPLLSVERALVP